MTAQPVGVMPLSGALPTTYPDPDPDPDLIFTTYLMYTPYVRDHWNAPMSNL